MALLTWRPKGCLSTCAFSLSAPTRCEMGQLWDTACTLPGPSTLSLFGRWSDGEVDRAPQLSANQRRNGLGSCSLIVSCWVTTFLGRFITPLDR